MTHRVLNMHSVATKPLWWWGGWAHCIIFMTSLYMYYALCFVHVEHTVCHEPTLAVVWALWSFKIFFWSELYWWALKERNSCCIQIDRIYIYIYISVILSLYSINNKITAIQISPCFTVVSIMKIFFTLQKYKYFHLKNWSRTDYITDLGISLD